jgi:hypothetical protein
VIDSGGKGDVSSVKGQGLPDDRGCDWLGDPLDLFAVTSRCFDDLNVRVMARQGEEDDLVRRCTFHEQFARVHLLDLAIGNDQVRVGNRNNLASQQGVPPFERFAKFRQPGALLLRPSL